jgi:hypothetical protein
MYHRLLIVEILLAAAILLAGVVATRTRLAIPLLVLLAVTLPFADQAWEGAVLIHFSSNHGFVVPDLLSVAALAWAAWLLVRRRP